MNAIMREDLNYIHSKIDFSRFEGKKILITGATGLIGSSVVISLLEWNQTHENKIQIVVLVRSREKCRKVFSDYPEDAYEAMTMDVCTLSPDVWGIDYIIHGASQTASKAFVENPVETILTAIEGTKNVLELARLNKVKGFVYLSSMEVYGTPKTDEKIYEDRSTNLNVLQVRTCYPESKRMCENLCVSYASEYGVPARILRLTQTFGTGVSYHDGRVFAEFARCVIEKRDIVLKTKGKTKRSYLYTADAVTAILTVLLNGSDAQAYNAANEETYCSIYEMAQAVVKLSEEEIQVVIEENAEIQKFGYAPTLKMNLSTDKLKAIGWNAAYGLEDMYRRMIASMERE